jgi:hypothetical protein
MNSQLKLLLSDISGHSSRHLTEIQSDLVQTTLLLDEAVTKLTESFEGVAKGVSAYQEAMVCLLAAGPTGQTPEELERVVRLRAVNEILTLHLNAAVTRLQFEDITSQLIRRAVRRVDGLREILECLGNAALQELEDEAGQQGTKVDVLEELLDSVRQKSQLIDDQLRNAIAQRRLDCGDMELF